jgi:hypothetical protein
MFRVDNVLIKIKQKLGMSKAGGFEGSLRKLDLPERLSVRVSSTAAEDLKGTDYKPANLREYAERSHDFTGIIEPVVRLPKTSREETLGLLEPLGKPPA